MRSYCCSRSVAGGQEGEVVGSVGTVTQFKDRLMARQVEMQELIR